jgi:asparagine synthase (glutamine-hydrolysing)
MDMLHVDVWWRGQNVLVDPGSYLYNGPPRWHRHFAGTASHNTVQVDGGDQMLHFRQFKMLFPTEARLLRFEDAPEWAICEGEHYGFKREARCVHRRLVLFVKDDLWVVADTIAGEGVHQARLHWLAGDYPWVFDPPEASLRLETPEGPFTVTILDGSGNPIPSVDVVAGQDRPERGWQSRYYGEKIPVPSIAATQSGAVPVTFVTLMGAGRPRALIHAGEWEVACNGHSVRFSIEGGALRGLSVAKSVPELLA